jgi:multiple sugar transport system ATP-binding protein
MAKVTFNHVYKKYNEHLVVNDFHLDIQDKEFLVLVGPSGCGKSTTLRMIAGLEEISQGDLYIGDRRVNDVPPKHRDIAMVFQNYALYPHMSIYDNMAFSLKLMKYSKKEIDERVKEAADKLDIRHLLDRKPKALSGGQRQRVALGRAIVREPQVFLMDEPLSNLDAKLRVQMRTEIAKLHKKIQTTVVYVTHDQTEALTMGDRIVVMKDGVIQQVDTPSAIYENPANRFVAGFIGSPAMNFIEGTLMEEEQNVYFVTHNGKVSIYQGMAATLRERGYVGKEVILGIRPEAIHDEAQFVDFVEGSRFQAKVEMVENLGSELYLYVTGFGEQMLTAKVNARSSYQTGDEILLGMDLNKVHFFDKESDLAII